MTTRTGHYPIGFRRGWGNWQKDLKTLAAWAKEHGFEAIDLGAATAADAATVRDAGLRVGTADIPGLKAVANPDPAQRRDAIERATQYIQQTAALGIKTFFAVIVPADPAQPRGENYKLAVEGLAPVCHAAHAAGASLAVEGWPGGSPYLANLACTPETVRALLKDIGPGFGLNYDPSHLIRLGVDHIRFLREFAPHVKHVHGKDTDLDADALYEYGTLSSAFAKPHGFGEWAWRYTLPGHGQTRWVEVLSVLKNAGYQGIVSVELEDENFNGSDEGEQAGLLHALNYLRGI